MEILVDDITFDYVNQYTWAGTFGSYFGNYKMGLIHRFIAKKYIPNPENKTQINHKNGLKNDNRICNLEWCTSSENIQHAYDTGLKKPTLKQSQAVSKSNQKKCKIILDLKTGIFYDSLLEASKYKEYHPKYLSRVLNNRNKNYTNLIYV